MKKKQNLFLLILLSLFLLFGMQISVSANNPELPFSLLPTQVH